MARIDNKLRMEPALINAIMEAEPRLRIATLGPAADINLTPMTFGWAGGHVYLFGRGQKVANLRRTPTATVLVDTGDAWTELRGIMMRGEARVLEDLQAEKADPYLQEACENIGVKHGLVRDGKPAAYKATASGKSRRWIVFTPRRTVSWDNQNL